MADPWPYLLYNVGFRLLTRMMSISFPIWILSSLGKVLGTLLFSSHYACVITCLLEINIMLCLQTLLSSVYSKTNFEKLLIQ